MKKTYLMCSLLACVLFVNPDSLANMLVLFGNLIIAASINGCFKPETKNNND